MTKVVQVLEAAKELLSDEAKLCRDACARDASGRSVSAESGDAVCFCAVGAVGLASFRLGCDEIFDDAIDALDHATDGTNIVLLVRHAPHADIIAAFDRAIAKQKEQSHVPV